MSATTSALVIGGGIAGPVTATALRMAGIDVTVYEAYPAPSEGIGGTLAIAPNGMAALGIVGADEAVRDAALAITGQSMSIAGHSLGRLRRLEGVEPQRMIGRGDLHRVLHDRAVEVGVRFEYGKRLVGVDEGADAVTARFADGSTATGGVLIGADGVRSTVRTRSTRTHRPPATPACSASRATWTPVTPWTSSRASSPSRSAGARTTSTGGRRTAGSPGARTCRRSGTSR